MAIGHMHLLLLLCKGGALEERAALFHEVEVFGAVWVTVVNILSAVKMTEDIWFGRYIHGFCSLWEWSLMCM
ncbi:hypothetical protein GIB67_003174 [Kingdonia uniflora]|uniref:Uncharacterized protein n=1 Tax=Kingdonia uniflora TaxID=39325 RepID=A0A7J7N6V6_9MAGN|nr:hypothetical protein GIB67_003174 [Kingdonia uniflora]